MQSRIGFLSLGQLAMIYRTNQFISLSSLPNIITFCKILLNFNKLFWWILEIFRGSNKIIIQNIIESCAVSFEVSSIVGCKGLNVLNVWLGLTCLPNPGYVWEIIHLNDILDLMYGRLCQFKFLWKMNIGLNNINCFSWKQLLLNPNYTKIKHE